VEAVRHGQPPLRIFASACQMRVFVKYRLKNTGESKTKIFFSQTNRISRKLPCPGVEKTTVPCCNQMLVYRRQGFLDGF
jgi:hypothetical protein